jgi:hypothetical protein
MITTEDAMSKSIPENTRLNWCILLIFVITVFSGVPRYVYPNEDKPDAEEIFCSMSARMVPTTGAVACQFSSNVKDGSIEMTIEQLL